MFVNSTCLGCLLIICSLFKTTTSISYKPFSSKEILLQKMSLTQRGYIQFLRYINKVPPLTDYTFCIWLRSSNLTYSHPILSYSKNEEERLIRVWISPYGTHLNLEILEHKLFKLPVNFIEHKWYHICQSWSSYQATWNVYLDGKLQATGHEQKLKGVVIKGGGDIVVGQEYTDFDKGLDDGIEGDIFGFNFVLSSTSQSLKNNIKYPNQLVRRYATVRTNHLPYEKQYTNPFIIVQKTTNNNNYQPQKLEIPTELSYFKADPARQSKSFFDFGKNMFNSVMNFFDDGEEIPKSVPVYPYNRYANRKSPTVFINKNVFYKNVRPYEEYSSKIYNEINHFNPKTNGLRLVELSYNCALGKGSPVEGGDVLVSWTKSPVRVFGGAILKLVPPFCDSS